MCWSLCLAQEQITKSLLVEAVIQFCVISSEGMSLRQVQGKLYNVLAGLGSHAGKTAQASPFIHRQVKRANIILFGGEICISMQKLNAKYPSRRLLSRLKTGQLSGGMVILCLLLLHSK